MDREGYRRGTSRARDGSPVRERRHRPRHDEDVSDRERDRELRRQRHKERERERTAAKHTSTDSTNSASQLLSADALAKLNEHYEQGKGREYKRMSRQDRTRDIPNEDLRVDKKRRRRHEVLDEKNYDEHNAESPRQSQKRRLVSGAVMEEGRSNKLKFWRRGGGGGGPIFGGGRGGRENGGREKDGGDDDDDDGEPFWKRRKKLLIALGVIVLILAIVIPVAIVVSKKQNQNNNSTGSSSSGDSPGSSTSNLTSSLSSISRDSIPAAAQGTYFDPFTWYDTRDFNLTYTNETVGGLPIMGLNSTWDDSAQPNSNVPALKNSFPYGSSPIRGVNIGGWLSIEPFITPSFFAQYPITAGIVDEYTLSQKLGSSAASTIEAHYATFIQEEDFAEIAAAGLDHVRIPYSYWAVTTYPDDPYVEKIAWRYLLRAIEYCRKYGIRVNLDLHGLPGSQNGYNHSGRQGLIGWLNGTDGALNAQRSLDIHDQLSQFFAQDRYKNIVTIYGLANEPPLLTLDIATVLNWTVKATDIVQKNGIKAMISMGDGFLNLDKWQYIMKTDVPSNLLLDTHQYTIFNVNEIDLAHADKINLTCTSWLPMLEKVNSTTNGWGPTICGEFSQADTDCAQYLNNVGSGTRWAGNIGSTSDPRCPTATGNSNRKGTTCSCDMANAAVSSYSDDYKKFLQTYAESQIYGFEKMMGWFYWTWQTESAPQWSYKQARDGGFMPKLAYEPSFKCGDAIPDFGTLPEYY
ncbi:glycoside hydrolase superfamily [Talaromyces proteolyticus]|uniref:glucan 1,3-beta-glucosidase n=1 Tax=Talaromyces proteolyticus TaxID=1131652 RepID=A0AAD4L6P6_9EURO|nr:glycoside hydrolase superfamily [Talaromyces proteolyticus]KAH8704944.1 glycoside hydrolase superfamily [Talaromyces proteolyticus]